MKDNERARRATTRIEKRTYKVGGKQRTRWYPVVRFPDGRKDFKGGFKTKTDAQEFARTLDRAIAAGTYGKPAPEDPTLHDFFNRWIDSKRDIKQSTLENMKSTYAHHIEDVLGPLRLSEVTPLVIQSWVDGLSETKLSAATVGKCYRYLRAAMNTAEAWGLVERCPCRSISLPRVERKEVEPLTREEVRRVLDYASGQERVLYALLAYSGLRLGEALGLAWRHVDLNHNVLIVERAWNRNGLTTPKTESSRRAVPVTSTLAAMLHEYEGSKVDPLPDAFLFTQGGDQPLDPSKALKDWSKAQDAVGVRHCTLHSLRHFYASVMLEAGCSIRYLQHSLGHSSPTMTLGVYSHLMKDSPGDSLLKFDTLVNGEEEALPRIQTKM